MYKQAIVLRKDLKLSLGKAIAQACHASIEASSKAEPGDREAWHSEGSKKVVLEAKTLEDLQKLFQAAKDAGLAVALIKDAGLTEIPPGTITAIAIGPNKENAIDKITGELPLVK
ncbi:MAG: peptidyl-tRNA hydrolase Pth2 [archaeon]